MRRVGYPLDLTSTDLSFWCNESTMSSLISHLLGWGVLGQGQSMSLSDEQLSALMSLRKLYLRNLGAVVRRRNELTAALQVRR